MKDKNGRPIIIRKKKVVVHAHHGGAWKVAYADFVTAMMSLFIVLWLMNSNAKVKEAVAGYFKDPAGVGKLMGTTKEGHGKTDVIVKAPPPAKVEQPVVREQVIVKVDPAAKAEMDKLKQDMEKALKNLPAFPKVKDHVAIVITGDGVRMELMETAKGLFFENGSPTPTQEGRTVLEAATALIRKMPNRVMVEGHTDSVPYAGTTGYSNWELSSDRANAARIIMQKAGIRPGQLYQIRGFADQELRLADKPKDPSNRRISIIVLNLPQKAGSAAAPKSNPTEKPGSLLKK